MAELELIENTHLNWWMLLMPLIIGPSAFARSDLELETCVAQRFTMADGTEMTLRLPTSIRFCNGDEIITDNRQNGPSLYYRPMAGSTQWGRCHPSITLNRPHSLTCAEGHYYATDTAGHAVLMFDDLASPSPPRRHSTEIGIAWLCSSKGNTWWVIQRTLPGPTVRLSLFNTPNAFAHCRCTVADFLTLMG